MCPPRACDFANRMLQNLHSYSVFDTSPSSSVVLPSSTDLRFLFEPELSAPSKKNTLLQIISKTVIQKQSNTVSPLTKFQNMQNSQRVSAFKALNTHSSLRLACKTNRRNRRPGVGVCTSSEWESIVGADSGSKRGEGCGNDGLDGMTTTTEDYPGTPAILMIASAPTSSNRRNGSHPTAYWRQPRLEG